MDWKTDVSETYRIGPNGFAYMKIIENLSSHRSFLHTWKL